MRVLTVWTFALLPLVFAHPVHYLIGRPPRGSYLRAAPSPLEGLPLSESPSASPSPYGIVLDGEFAKLDSRVPIFSCPQFTTEYLRVLITTSGHLRVPHSRILTNGLPCGPLPANATDEELLSDTYMELISIDDLLTSEIADERGVLGAYKKLTSKRPYTAQIYRFLVQERNNDPGGPPPIYIGYERYNTRKCGDVELGIESLVFIGSVQGVKLNITRLIPRLDQGTRTDGIVLTPGRGFHVSFTPNGTEPEHVCPSVVRTQTLLTPPLVRECFPGGMTVISKRGIIDVSDVQIGDRLFDGNEFSEVVMLTHRDHTTSSTSIELLAEGFTVQASRGHLLVSTDGLVQAADFDVGMALYTTQGVKTVTEVSVVDSVGLFNMQTASGLVEVNGVLASCYTNAVQPFLAHALLTPVRLVFAVRRLMLPYGRTLHARLHASRDLQVLLRSFVELVKTAS